MNRIMNVASHLSSPPIATMNLETRRVPGVAAHEQGVPLVPLASDQAKTVPDRPGNIPGCERADRRFGPALPDAIAGP